MDVEAVELLDADFNAFLVQLGIQFTTYGQACRCRRGSNQLHNGQPALQGLAAPILTDMAKKPMFNLVPFRLTFRLKGNLS